VFINQLLFLQAHLQHQSLSLLNGGILAVSLLLVVVHHTPSSAVVAPSSAAQPPSAECSTHHGVVVVVNTTTAFDLSTTMTPSASKVTRFASIAAINRELFFLRALSPAAAVIRNMKVSSEEGFVWPGRRLVGWRLIQVLQNLGRRSSGRRRHARPFLLALLVPATDHKIVLRVRIIRVVGDRDLRSESRRRVVSTNRTWAGARRAAVMEVLHVGSRRGLGWH